MPSVALRVLIGSALRARYSDWTVTMPLLVLELYAIIDRPDQDLILNTVNASALCAAVMIALGAYVRLGLDEMASFSEMPPSHQVQGVLSYAVSLALLCLLLVDLSQAYLSDTKPPGAFSFFLVWPLYALTAIGTVFFRQDSQAGESNFYPPYLAITKDTVYAALDVFSKAILAWKTSSAAFGISVLGD